MNEDTKTFGFGAIAAVLILIAFSVAGYGCTKHEYDYKKIVAAKCLEKGGRYIDTGNSDQICI